MDVPAQILPQKVVKSKLRLFIENAIYIAGAIVLALLIQTFVARPFIVSGNSMDPVIKNSEYLIIDEVSYRFHPPKRGDVVVFKSPPEPKKYYIKRIIGLPGETVEIKGSIVTIFNNENPKGFALKEPFIVHHSLDNMRVTVSEDHYFVMGDNRSGSYDSRMWGLLPKANIRGRAYLRLLPIKYIDYLPGEYTYEK